MYWGNQIPPWQWLFNDSLQEYFFWPERKLHAKKARKGMWVVPTPTNCFWLLKTTWGSIEMFMGKNVTIWSIVLVYCSQVGDNCIHVCSKCHHVSQLLLKSVYCLCSYFNPYVFWTLHCILEPVKFHENQSILSLCYSKLLPSVI